MAGRVQPPPGARPARWVSAEPASGDATQVGGLAFEDLVRAHQGFVRAWLRRLTRGDAQLADDLAQDTFLRALRALPGFRGDSHPRTWLARIALNVWHDHLRRSGARPQPSPLLLGPDDAAPDSSPDVPDDAPGPADVVANRLDLDRALQRLPEAERTVIIHACWGDLSQSEIAALTGLPLGTVKTLSRRGLARLQTWLGEGS